PARSGPAAWPMSPIVPCIPIPAPSVLNSELSATRAEDDEETTASPNPKPAESNNNNQNIDTCGIHIKVAAQITRPTMMSGLRPTLSDPPPIIGLDTSDVRA